MPRITLCHLTLPLSSMSWAHKSDKEFCLDGGWSYCIAAVERVPPCSPSPLLTCWWLWSSCWFSLTQSSDSADASPGSGAETALGRRSEALVAGDDLHRNRRFESGAGDFRCGVSTDDRGGHP